MTQFHYFRRVLLGLVSSYLVACGVSGPENVRDPSDEYVAFDDKNTNAEKTNVDTTGADKTSAEIPSAEKPSAEIPSADGTLPFGPGMSRPKQISGPSLSLPPLAVANYVRGEWIARCIITAEGSTEGCQVVKGLPYSDEHIVQILHAQKYTPVVYQDKRQGVFYTFKITFK